MRTFKFLAWLCGLAVIGWGIALVGSLVPASEAGAKPGRGVDLSSANSVAPGVPAQAAAQSPDTNARSDRGEVGGRSHEDRVSGVSNDPSLAAGGASPSGRGRENSPVGRRAVDPDAGPEMLSAAVAGGAKPADILIASDLSNPEERALAVAKIAEIQEARRDAAHERAAQLGLPITKRAAGGFFAEIYDFRGEEPLYRVTLNANAAISSGANLVVASPYLLSGSGVTVGVWDGGSVRNTHQEFGARVTKKNSSAAIDDHATHVAGTILASGVKANAKGMAPSAKLDSYDWDADYAEMTAAGAAAEGDSSRIAISNHSYGYDAVTADMGRYEEEARSVDAVAAALPYYLPFWAAGNEQDTLTAYGGFQSITFTALAKNALTVGAVNDAVAAGVRSTANAAMAYFSSWGPCDDGRIKPDIVANGIDLYSSVSTSNTAYDTYSGTSMATPSAAGSAALLQQLWAKEFSGKMIRASTLKALLIHTADDLGNAGPDYKFGWGLINTKAAADLVLAHKNSLAEPKIVEGAVTASQTSVSRSFTWDGSSPIRATLAWTDPAGSAQTAADSRVPNLVHNLDVKVTGPSGTIYRPYVMPFVGTWTSASMNATATTGKNDVDNVEQVYIAAPSAAGNYTVTVSLDGSLTTASQAYSLILTGSVSVATNPPPDVVLTSPADGSAFLVGQAVALSANASDTVIGGGAGTVAQVEFLVNGSAVATDTAAPFGTSWVPQGAGVYALAARATDSEGAASTSPEIFFTVLAGNGIPSVNAISPSSGVAGDRIVVSGENFAGITSVEFGGVAATTYSVDSTQQITATVPAGAQSGPVTVTNAYGTGQGGAFTVVVSPVLISQIYGGGGQAGATYSADYVELYNRGNATVSLSGWSVQYASASGSTWQQVSLGGSISAGGYYLVKLAGGSSGGALPAADVTGSINMSATNGKVALRDSAASFSGSSPAGQTGLQDFVGYGSANTYEGGAPAPSPSITAAIFRAGGGAADTGDNADDFTVSAPNPRNSSGGVLPPVITSSASAGGTVGQAFSYQITASNGPASYGASSLPAGLSLDSASGLISGIPSVAGTTNATISATNSAGTGSSPLSIVIVSGGGGSTSLFSEDFASLTSGNSTSTNGSPTTWNGNTNFLTVSNAFQAGGSVKLGSSNSAGSITSKKLDLGGNGGNFTVSFSVKGWTTVEGSILVSVTGLATQNVTYLKTMADGFETKTLNFTGGGANATVTFQTSAKRAFLDNVIISQNVPASPEIIVSGSPGALTATYGAASDTVTNFMVAGTNLTSGIGVQAPPGFEVSGSSGSGFSGSVTVGGAGNVTALPVYLRLAAGVPAGSYSGEVECSSPGAVPRTLAVPPAEVRKKLASITAADRSKPFGQTIDLGTSAFKANGFVGSETVGEVTLSAEGGTGLYDHPGNYSVTPSAASGGTFDAANYDIGYYPGTLTVTARTFGEFAPSGQPAGDPDGNGLPNLVEYYLGADVAGTASAPSITARAGALEFYYTRGKNTAGVGAVVEWNSDLSDQWKTEGVIDEMVSDEGPYEIRRASLAIDPSEARKFLRLRVEQK